MNRRATLPGVSVDALVVHARPRGAAQRRRRRSTASPSAGSLYGALEVVGLPADAATRKGVVLGYRLHRDDPGRAVVAASRASSAGTPKASKGTAVISVRNTGNTVDPVTGSITLRGAGGSRTRSVQAVRILPGKSVNIPLGTKLARGTLHRDAAAHPARHASRCSAHQAVLGQMIGARVASDSGSGRLRSVRWSAGSAPIPSLGCWERRWSRSECWKGRDEAANDPRRNGAERRGRARGLGADAADRGRHGGRRQSCRASSS